jgi:hypothetical protein
MHEELNTPLEYDIHVNGMERKEYLVPYPIIEKEAIRENLQVVLWANVQQFYAKHKDNEQYRKWYEECNLTPTSSTEDVTEDEWDLCKLFAVFIFKKIQQETTF